MTRHHHPILRSFLRRLRPSAARFAAAAAVYDPAPLMRLQATER